MTQLYISASASEGLRKLKEQRQKKYKVDLKREQHLMIYGVWKRRLRKGKFTTASSWTFT